VKLTWSRQRIVCAHPFGTARDTSTAKQTIVVRLDHDGVTGLGEAAPVSYYGQSVASAAPPLGRAAPLLGDDPFCFETILDRLCAAFGDQRATIAAIDAALHDWVGKRLGVPVWRLLGIDPAGMPTTSFTIGVDNLETIALKVRQADDYPILKIKIGTENEVDILETVRHHAPDKTLRVDANTGWSSGDADARLQRVLAYDLELVEQPVLPGEDDTLTRLTQASPVPVIADESAVVPADVPALAGCVDGINIKLSKCGGIREAYRMIAIARALDMKIMLGCMIESSLGIAAAAQLAPLVDYVDLDGHLLLAEDPFTGLDHQNGKLILSTQPGLGVSAKGSIAN
jgi:L-alanine-DL-glutamate epimerase-like enolase superfamily enzyme